MVRSWRKRGFALQSLSALSSLTLGNPPDDLLGSSLTQLDFALGESSPALREGSAACMQSSLQSLNVQAVLQFPTCVTSLTNLRSLVVTFDADVNSVPAGLRACSLLTRLVLAGYKPTDDSDMYDDDGEVTMLVDICPLEPRSYPSLQDLCFGNCRLQCDALLVHAAHLPSIKLINFYNVAHATAGSLTAMRELALVLDGLGKEDVLQYYGYSEAFCRTPVLTFAYYSDSEDESEYE